MPQPSSLRRKDAASKPRRSRKTASSSSIIEAARRLFLEHGYDGVNLERVGEAAGVSRQTVYNQFGSKEAVFRAVVSDHWDNIKSDDVLTVCETDEALDAVNVLTRFAEAIIRFVEGSDQIAFTRLVIAESRRLPWIAEEFYKLGKEPLLEAFSRRLELMTLRGLLTCEDRRFAAHQFMGLVQEFVIWPKVMAIGDGLKSLPADDVVIREAVRMFLCRYRTEKP